MAQGRPTMLASMRRLLGESGLDACMMILCSYSISPRSEWVRGMAATSCAFALARYSGISEAVDEVYTRYAAQGVRKFAHLHYGLRFLQASRLVALL